MNKLPNITEILVNTFQTIIDQFVDFVPKFIGAVVVLGVGFLVARFVAMVVSRVLSKIGLDRFGDKLNEIDFIRQLQTEIKLSKIIAQVLYYYILIVFITAATEKLGIAAITEMVMNFVNFIPKLIAAAIMLQIGIMVAEALRKTVVNVAQSFNINSARLLGMIVFFFFLTITIISALGQAGINTDLLESSFNLLVGGVIVAFAVGYAIASRDVMANILSSFYSRNRFREGQIIEIDNVRGEIIKMDSTTITLQTGDSTTIFPLQTLQSKKVEIFKY